jgi:phage gp46-like protein
MTGTQAFEGDILLIDTADGGDIVIEEGLVKGDRAFNTAVYISLFGGNKNDSGKVKTRKTWWGNTLKSTPVNEKIASRLQAVISAMPLTVKNVREAETAAELDLAWMIKEGIAEKIEASGTTEGKNRFRLLVKISNSGTTIYENSYSVLWEGGLDGV